MSSFLWFFLGWERGDATTYSELMKRALTEEKPAQVNTEEESPVLVRYEIGDTSNFFTTEGKAATDEEESEWEEWDEEE